MKLISWNVNGLRACLNKGFLDFFRRESPDFLCLQETKMVQGQAQLDLGEGWLELRGEKGLLRHGGVHHPRTAERGLWHGQGYPRPRGAAHHFGV